MSEIFSGMGSVGSGGGGTTLTPTQINDINDIPNIRDVITPFIYASNNETNFNIVHNKGARVSNIVFDDGASSSSCPMEYIESVDNNSLAFLITAPYTGDIIIFF